MAQIVQTGNVGSGSFRIIRDSRDLIQDPASGGYNLLSAELGTVDADKYELIRDHQLFPGGVQRGVFQRSLELRRYFSKGGPRKTHTEKRSTLAVRLRFGMSGGTLPFFEQFFVGGAESLRGYTDDRFWARRCCLPASSSGSPSRRPYQELLFVDYGDAWDAPEDYFIGELPQSSSFEGISAQAWNSGRHPQSAT